MSIRAASRVTGVAKGTIIRLLESTGDAAAAYHSDTVRGLTAKRVQCDEIWGFVQKKQRNVARDILPSAGGDAWTWIGIDSDTKLVISYLCGDRSRRFAQRFVQDLAERVDSRVQISTDGLGMYADIIIYAFGHRADYGTEVKTYGSEDKTKPDTRYSPSFVTGVRRTSVFGEPDPDHISTAHIERLNLTVRMHCRRLTRLTNAFSKKLQNLRRALALHFMYYNFCRVHSTVKTTPAIAAGLTDRIWTLHDLANLSNVMRDSAA
jgi:IS1 family transposase